jgi:hypothetical protein
MLLGRHCKWTIKEDGENVTIWHSHFAADVETYSPDGKKLLDSSTWHLNERK